MKSNVIQAVNFLLIATCTLAGQSPIIPEDAWSQRFIDRLDILYGSNIFTSNGNFRRHEAFRLAEHLYFNPENLKPKDHWDLEYLLLDNNEFARPILYLDSLTRENNNQSVFIDIGKPSSLDTFVFRQYRKPFFKYLYRTPAHFFEVDAPGFTMRLNPVLDLKAGGNLSGNDIPFRNLRGVHIRGYIDNKVYFFTSLYENQARFFDFHEDRINRFRAIPGAGFYSDYQSSIINRVRGRDFFNAQGYAGLSITNSINVELGHGRHVIGNGIRSMLLSNYAANYFYLKFNTQVWKLHYQNIFAELTPISSRWIPGDVLLPKKYMTNHYLTFKVSSGFEIGLFESVIFNRESRFELQYLNPVIFYRFVEHALGSPDKILLGMNTRLNFAGNFQIYGQFIIDEFKLSEWRSGNGWWSNNYGIQLGLKYINVGGIDHLDAQLEYNTAAPYTYTHRDTLPENPMFSPASYSHYNQPLGHPLGANFREVILSVQFRASKKLDLSMRYIRSAFGDDAPGRNWGGNILLPYTTREMEYGNRLLQGERTDVSLLGLDATYVLGHNIFLDVNALFRKSNSTLERNTGTTNYIGGGLRMNLGVRNIDY